MLRKIIKKIKRCFFKFKNNDPLYKCPVYKDKGCCHVDGPLCDFPHCNIVHEYLNDKFVFCPDCVNFDDCISGHFGFGCYNGKKLNL